LAAQLSHLHFLAGGAKKCIKVGGEFYSSGKLDETVGVHKAQTAQNYNHQQGEPSTRVMDVGDQDSWKSTNTKSLHEKYYLGISSLRVNWVQKVHSKKRWVV